MKRLVRGVLPLFTIFLLAAIIACGPPDDPELVALAYVRATHSGDPDTAVQLLDIDGIADRVEQEIVLVDSSGRESFLEDSIETVLWGLFRETRPADFIYDATPADIDGDTARVTVTLTAPDESTQKDIVHLRKTEDGWRVSGTSLDSLVTVVVQRLQEKY